MRVCVAMCTYNGSKYIEEQLQSILNQTRVPDEIIICDDGSKDDTLAKANAVLEGTSVEYRIISNDKNLGYIKNFEKCAALCSGDIVFFADQDDVWVNTKVEKVECVFAENPDCVLCFHDATVVDEWLNTIQESLNQSNGIAEECFLERVLNSAFPYGCTMAMAKWCIMENVPFRCGHDEWLSKCAPFFGTVVGLTESLMLYRRHNQTATGYLHKVENVKGRRVKVLKDFLKKMKNKDKERWFGWPSAAVDNHSFYIHRFGEKLKALAPDYYTNKPVTVALAENLAGIIHKPRFQAVMLLIEQYRCGNYQIRGNWKVLMMDCLYLLLY